MTTTGGRPPGPPNRPPLRSERPPSVLPGLDDEPDQEPDQDEVADLAGDEEPRRGFFRRHRVLTAFTAIFALLLAGVLGSGWYLNHQIDKIPRFTLKVPGPRPPSDGRALNFLLAGADNGDAGGPTIAEEVNKGGWIPGSHRSDTIMVLHVTADRRRAYVVSIPRDTYVSVAGHGKQKINAAFSYGGPSLMVQTVETLTAIRMDHVAIIDWNGFRDLSTALGGVRVYVAENSYDSASGLRWTTGYQTVQGDRALRYVRQRHGLPRGDFDRIRRQQNFLRSALGQAAQKGNLTNPVRFTKMLKAITSNLTVDSGLSTSGIRSLAWSLRSLRPSDITFIQVPFGRFATKDVGSVVIPKEAQTRELFSDVSTDDLDKYLAKYGTGDVLAGANAVD